MNKKDLMALESFRIQLPAQGTPEVNYMYTLVIDILRGRWVGKVGHYAWSNIQCQVAVNQNGYLYVFKKDGQFMITADCSLGLFEVDTQELTMENIKTILSV